MIFYLPRLASRAQIFRDISGQFTGSQPRQSARISPGRNNLATSPVIATGIARVTTRLQDNGVASGIDLVSGPVQMNRDALLQARSIRRRVFIRLNFRGLTGATIRDNGTAQ